jgi:hypothetical protein
MLVPAAHNDFFVARGDGSVTEMAKNQIRVRNRLPFLQIGKQMIDWVGRYLTHCYSRERASERLKSV